VAEYAEFAGEAEAAVVGRHLRTLCLLPTTKLGRDGWPPTLPQRLHRRWNYWWQAHLLDCLVDAQLREPTARRVRLIRRVARTIWLRNRLSWVNNYFDDMAWLGLALQRAASDEAGAGLDVDRPLALLTAELRGAWTDDAGGGIRWRRDTSYKNAPANGPAAILHARVGELERAAAIAEWMAEHLVDPSSGLVWDGLAVYPGTEREPVPSKRIYTYCQGVYLGACLELDGPQWQERAERTVAAVAQRLAPGGVLRGHGGGDGGLFTGILARYLALAAQRLPAGDAADTARGLVLTSAEACWANATRVRGMPLFGPEWAKPVDVPRADAKAPAQHLSVQLGAWMLLEAAAAVNGPTAPPPAAC
jgi:predicted alpha-1,6-mannanase (GH76 family)